MLSVPARLDKKVKKPRQEEWQDAVMKAQAFAKDDTCRAECVKLSGWKCIPRKEFSFYGFLERSIKVTQVTLQQQIWCAVLDADKYLNRIAISDIPTHLVSAFEILQDRIVDSKPLYIVHRLDCETSGLLLFAKTQSSCVELGRQFRDREIKKIYLAEVLGMVSPRLYKILAPVNSHPDYDMKPRQVVDNLNGKAAETLVTVVKYKNCPFAKDVEDLSVPTLQECCQFSDEKNATEKLTNNCDIEFAYSSPEEENVNKLIPSTLIELEPITGRTHQVSFLNEHSS